MLSSPLDSLMIPFTLTFPTCLQFSSSLQKLVFTTLYHPTTLCLLNSHPMQLKKHPFRLHIKSLGGVNGKGRVVIQSSCVCRQKISE